MSWVRLDVGFPRHPKVLDAGPAAAWLHVCGLCYCAGYLTDGRIPKRALPLLADMPKIEAHARRLVEVGLWVDEGDSWVVHDYLEWQEAREDVEGRRAEARERQRRSRARRTSAKNGPVTAPVTRDSHVTHSEVTLADTDTEVTTSSSTEVTRAPRTVADDGDDLADREGRAALVLAEREADGHTDIRNRRSWTRARARTLRKEHQAEAQRYLAEHPDATPEQLARYLAGERPVERCPDCGMAIGAAHTEFMCQVEQRRLADQRAS